MALKEDFQNAAAEVQKLSQRPGTADLLSLYSFYKQSTVGDVVGERPGILNFTGRSKYDAWAAIKGMPPETAMRAYIDLVAKLKAKN